MPVSILEEQSVWPMNKRLRLVDLIFRDLYYRINKTLTAPINTRPGLGVFVRRGTFWYPGRILDCPGGRGRASEFYSIQLWRGCVLDDEAKGLSPADMVVSVLLKDIVDCLFNDSTTRRTIRVRVYTFRCDHAATNVTYR